MKNELDVPAAVLLDPKATELLRIWAASGLQHISLVLPWKDPAAWGLLLVDLAHHIANAYAQADGLDQAEVLQRVRAAFDAEWIDRTDSARSAALS